MPPPNLNTSPLVFLDDSRPPHRAGRSMLFANPHEIIRADTLDEVEGALNALDTAVARGDQVAGFLSFELAAWFEPRLRRALKRPPEPYIWMLACPRAQSLDHRDTDAALSTAERGTARRAHLSLNPSPESETRFNAAFDHIRALIQSGDVYQVNHTFPVPAALTGDPLALYRQLRARQPVPFGAYIATEDNHHILSASPELMVARRGTALMAQPMKGTAPRGFDHNDDKARARALAEDPKAQAENLMIVDLIRNDLSRVATSGSVDVPSLFDVSIYPTLLQMTSTVTAAARPNLSPSALLAALFPCGSVTGAPKVRAIEIIAETEPAARGVYCGAIGHFSPGGDWTLNVPIRTLCFQAARAGEARTGRLSVGAGLVADSVRSAEYQECRLKAAFAAPSTPVTGDSTAFAAPSETTEPGINEPGFALIETMRADPAATDTERGSSNRIPRLAAHMARLTASAAYYDIPIDAEALEALISQHLKAHPQTAQRLRLLVDRFGAASLSSHPYQPWPDKATVACAGPALNAQTPDRRHKTTRRSLYNRASTAAAQAGHADLLFFNTQGHLAEGAISNVFVRVGDVWLTPPVEDGALPGVRRADYIQTLKASVQSITRDQLENAQEIRLTNAVRGVASVSLNTKVISL